MANITIELTEEEQRLIKMAFFSYRAWGKDSETANAIWYKVTDAQAVILARREVENAEKSAWDASA